MTISRQNASLAENVALARFSSIVSWVDHRIAPPLRWRRLRTVRAFVQDGMC
jgi:hypothetical protein